MFARDVQYLLQWLGNKRRKPLIFRGARQVGKSTLVRLFAEAVNLSLHEINLERHLFLDNIFKSLDMTIIVRELEALAGAPINAPGSCLFFR